MFNSQKRRQRQVVQFVELVVGDALEAPAVALAQERNSARRSARKGPKSLRRADGVVFCERCIVADTPLPRMRGLLGRRSLGSEEGILLRPAGSIHTFFMRFPIDIVFLDRDGCVLRIVESVRPWRTAAARGARAVVELRAGECARRGLAVGAVLEVE